MISYNCRHAVKPLHKAMLGDKYNPCREFGCFQRLFYIVVDHFVLLAVVKSQFAFCGPLVKRFHYIIIMLDYGWCLASYIFITLGFSFTHY